MYKKDVLKNLKKDFKKDLSKIKDANNGSADHRVVTKMSRYGNEIAHIGHPKERPKILEKYPIKTAFVKYKK